MTMTGRGHHLHLFKQLQANRKVFRSKSGLMPPRSGIQRITLRVKNNDPNTNSQRQGQQPRRKGAQASTRTGTINSFGGNNLSYVTAHLLIAEARPGPRSVQFSSFTPRCRQAPGGGGNCGRNVLHEHPQMSWVTVLNMTRTSRSRAPHLRSTSRWGEAGLVLTLKIHKQRRGGRQRWAC
jgi:hypothetical protein